MRRISWIRVASLLPVLVVACGLGSNSSSGSSTSSTSSTRSSTSSSGSAGGCGGGGGSWSSDVRGASGSDAPGDGKPTEPAPTGQQWKPVQTAEGCGRTGIRWVLVDEVCFDGEGNDEPLSLAAPMFRDGAIVGSNLFAVDATHLWSLDLATMERRALLTGVGQPLAVATYGSEIAIAAGHEGLVLVDASNPNAPRRARSIPLLGVAYDVQVVGTSAWVALGAGGIAEVDLATPTPTLKRTLPVAGFVAGLAVAANHVYAAACGTFLVIDRATGQVVANTWVPNPVVHGRLVAPAKKVTVLGNVAFVAAGRYGAVAMDVTSPSAPVVLGNCTEQAASFYASGVRAENGRLYVAGGEWGILPVDVSTPAAACQQLFASVPPDDDPGKDPMCSSKPPWEVMPWEQLWAPPPPAKDPVQTLPHGDRVYAFGDARRIGTRAVDVRDVAAPDLALVKRYDEPRSLLAIAASGSKVVVAGARGGVFVADAAGTLTRQSTPAALTTATNVALLEDGRWVTLDGEGLHVEGAAASIAAKNATGFASRGGSRVVVVRTTGVLEDVDVDQPGITFPGTAIPGQAHLPLALAANATSTYVAAPEWPATVRVGAQVGALDPHGVFDAEDILDPTLWRIRLPRRHLVATNAGAIEVAGVGPAAGLVVHHGSGMKKVALPAFTYAGVAANTAAAYAIAIDRSLYKSYLVSVRTTGAVPEVVSVEAFTGGAAGVAATADRVFVADAEGVVRAYAIATNGAAVPLATTAVGGSL